MPYCIRCSPFACENTSGLISVSISPSSNVRAVDDSNCRTSRSTVDYIPGPGIVNVSINAYAFAKGSEDKWLGSRCKGSAQASQTNIQRYDCKTDKWYLIPSRNHRAQIQGEIGSVSLGEVFFQGRSANSQIINNVSITSEEGVDIGAVLTYTGPPLGVTIPTLEPYTLTFGNGFENFSGFISGFQAQVDYPNPATVSYTFDFSL